MKRIDAKFIETVKSGDRLFFKTAEVLANDEPVFEFYTVIDVLAEDVLVMKLFDQTEKREVMAKKTLMHDHHWHYQPDMHGE